MKEDKQTLIQSENTSEDEEIIFAGKEKGTSYFGILLVVCSAFFYSLSSLTVKLMLSVHPMELLMFRYLGLCIFTLPIVVYKRQTLFPDNMQENVALCVHSFAGSAGGMFSFYAFRHMPLGDASSLCFSTPLFVVFLSVVFMNEKSSWYQWMVVSLTFLGVVLISKPESVFGVLTPQKIEAWGAISGILAAFCKANSFISLRLCKSLHWSVVVCHMGLVGSVSSLIYILLTHQICIPSSLNHRVILIGLSILGFLGQLFLTVASKTEKPATLSICRSTDILFAFLYQIFIFYHVPDAFSVIGSIFILTSVFLIKLKTTDSK